MTIDPSYYDASFVRIARYRNLLDLFLPSEVDEHFASVLFVAAGDDDLYASFLREEATSRYSADVKRRFYELARHFSAN